jgi:membrane-associated phospholipid phosphatase
MRRINFLIALDTFAFFGLTLIAIADRYLPGEDRWLVSIIALRQPSINSLLLTFSMLGSINVILPLWFLALAWLAFTRQWFWLARFLPIPVGYPIYLLLKLFIARSAPDPASVPRLHDFSIGYVIENLFYRQVQQLPPQGASVPSPVVALPPITTQAVTQVIESGYPSGHALMAALFYGIVALWFWRNTTGIIQNIGVIIFSAIAGLIGFARVYMGVHFPSDVLGAWTLAILCLSLLFWRTKQNGKPQN